MVAVILVMTGLTALISLYMINSFKLSEGSSFNFFRNIIILILSIDTVPGAIFAEYVGSRTMKRFFRWKEVGILIFAIAEFILLATVFLTISEVFFSQIEPIYQLPIAAINFAVVLVLWAYSTKIPVIHKQLEKMLH